MPGPRDYCADRSVRDGERLEGSAEMVTAWVMLEHRPPWSAKPLDDGSVPASTSAWMGRAADDLKAAGLAPRLQLIRQPERQHDERVLFLHLVRGAARELLGFVGGADRPPDVDIARLLGEPEAFAGNRLELPHYFVCTNGQRDLCCARFGLPLFSALYERVGARAWQTTHVGGHRFAPNVLVLPAGAVYGRVMPERVEDFVDASERGTLVDDLLRGRSWREAPVQAAEAYLLRDCGSVPDGAVEVTQHSDTVRVRFVETGAEVELRAVSCERITSCGDAKAKPTHEFELLNVALR